MVDGGSRNYSRNIAAGINSWCTNRFSALFSLRKLLRSRSTNLLFCDNKLGIELRTLESQYFQVINFKTAKLFESCGSLAGVLNEVNYEKQADLSRLGNIFGIMFQLTDDILDYSGKEIEIGKNVGDDLAEGKVTLPLIYAMKNGTDNQSKLIKDAIKMGDINRLPDIIQVLSDTNAIATVQKHLAFKVVEVNEVLGKFDDSETKSTLNALAHYIVERKG